MDTDADKINIATKEKRKHKRFHCNLEIEMETPYLGKKEVVCKNISEGGSYIEVVFNKFDLPYISLACLRNENIFLNICLHSENIKANGVVKWVKEIYDVRLPTERYYGVGIEFKLIKPEQQIKINNYLQQYNIENPNHLPTLLKFPLLINGREIDTGRYEFQPYYEKLITEPAYTFSVIKNIKQGKFIDNYGDFIYGKYCVGDEKLFLDAINSAYEASLIYKNFDIDRRTKIMVDIHNKLLSHKEKFIKLLVMEGHPRKLAEWELSGMLKGTTLETIHFYRMNMEIVLGHDRNEKIMLYRKPDGVVCLSTPKNAPSSISVIGIFALMAGNTLVVKPPLSIPISTIFFWKDIVFKSALENGAPSGTVNIIIGNSQKILQSWLDSPLVNDIIYIGDSKKGLEIGKKIYASGKKPILELSGNDKVFIWKDAPLEESSNALLESFFGSSQICMVPKSAFIHQDIFDDFMHIFTNKVIKLKTGLPSDPNTILAPVGKIKDFYRTLENALLSGGKLVCGGNRVNYHGIQDDKGFFIQPTVIVFDDRIISKDLLCVTEENFFPLLPIVKIYGKDDKEIFEKMIRFTEIDNFGLRISIWAVSENYIDKFINHIMPGGIIRINSSHTGFSLYLSNNGGTGRSGGPNGEMSYIWQKTTHLQGISISSI